MGYKVGVKGYRVWCKKLKRIINSRDIIFDEKNMLVSSRQRPLYNVTIPIDEQEEVQSPNNEEK